MKVLLIILVSVSVNSVAFGFELEIATDSTVHNLDNGTKTPVEANKKLSVVEKHPLWVTSPGRIPFLIVPLSAQGSVVKVDSPRAEQVFKEEKELRIDKALSEVTLYLSEINRLMANRELALASQKLLELKAQYPELRFLNFIEASIAFLSGERDKALAMVNLALSAHPGYQPGLELKKKIEGGN